MFVSVNPASGEVLGRFEPHSATEVDVALDKAVAAQRAWRRVPIDGRVELLLRLARALRSGQDRYADLITQEMGKPLTEARAEIEKCAVTCEFYAASAAEYLSSRRVDSNATESVIAYDPLGVVLAIMPWNFPFWQFFRFVAPALAAGNGGLLKHASNVPQCAIAIAELFAAADSPDGLVQNLMVPASGVAAIIADDRVAAVTLTGSVEVGAIVAAQAGAALKKQVLELGGSDPFVVLADADLDAAVAAAVRSRFVNGGQSCVNAKRFIVERPVADEFLERFVAGVRALTVGDPMDAATDIGPLAKSEYRDVLHEQVQRSVAGGAELRLGGQFVDGPGFFYEPTVLGGVRPGMAAFDEETFGPVAAIIEAADAEEALAFANQTPFGLGSTVWSGDPDRAAVMARQLDAGAVFVNGIVASDARLPFGGIKRSGYGRELGAEGIREFTNTKTIWTGPAVPEGHRHEHDGAPVSVVHCAEASSFSRGGGVTTVPLITKATGARSFLNGMTIFEPGAALPFHSHNCVESVVILEGEAIADIDGVPYRLSRWDTTHVAPGLVHRFRNVSADAELRILWTYGSIDATRTIAETGVTSRVDQEMTLSGAGR